MATVANQTNGDLPPTQSSAGGSTTVPNTQQSTGGPDSPNGSEGAAAATSSAAPGGGAPSGDAPPPAATSHRAQTRPRDSRTLELLLTSQGVTHFDGRVPLLLLDFAYRHCSGVLNDAIHLSTDPYTSHAGSKPSASSGAIPSAPAAGDAHVSTHAIALAIASRQAYQFRGGSGASAQAPAPAPATGGVNGASTSTPSGTSAAALGTTAGGGASKEWLAELARERNRVALPRIPANEWGVRLPGERFVLSGVGWGVRDDLGGVNGLSNGDGFWDDDDDEDDDDEGGDDAMEGLEAGAARKDGDAAESGGGGPGLGDMIAEDEEEDVDVEMEEGEE